MSTNIKNSMSSSSPVNNLYPSIKSAKNKNSTSSRFKKLWDKAEKARESNRLLEESLDKLVVKVQSQIAPHEHKLGLAIREQLFKLITFSSRKSLSHWQRDILDDWVAESMSMLHNLGLINDELLEHLARIEAQSLNITIDVDSDVPVVDQLSHAIQEQHEKEFTLHELDDVDTEEDFDVESWLEDHVGVAGFDFDDDDPGADVSKKSDEIKLQDSKTLFKTIFHRVARALHPDKVTDLKEKETRQQLMTQLLEARRNQDLMSVLKLHREHVDSDVEYGEKELEEFELVLKRFIDLQSDKRIETITQSPMHDMVYELFYSKNPATIEHKIKQHVKDIESRTVEIEIFVDSVNSLKSLKPHLESRYDNWYDRFSLGNRNRW